MRLIDADAMNAELFYKQVGGKDSLITAESAFEMINAQPTAYDVDAVVKQLEEEKNLHKRMIKYEQKNGTVTEEFQARRAVEVLERAIEIVKGGGADGN
mgnify:CR=1 FL=1